MADESCTDIVELKKLDSAVTITVEEASTLSFKDVEKRGSKCDSSCNPSPEKVKGDLVTESIANKEGDENMYTNTDITKAIETGNLEVVTNWLAKLPPDDKKKTLDSMKCMYRQVMTDSTIRTKLGTFLHLAAYCTQLAIAKLLIDEGADPNVKDIDGCNALHISIASSTELPDDDITAMIKFLIERSCDIDGMDKNQKTPLHWAAERNNTTAVRILLENSANMHLKDKFGDQPIHLAALFGRYKIVEVLVEKNAECVHWKGHNNRTPLHCACRTSPSGDHVQIVKYLINKGANVNAQNEDGHTPLCAELCVVEMYYVPQNVPEIVKLLIYAGANEINPLNVKWTPLQMACHCGYSDTVTLLLKHGAEVDSVAFETALKYGYEDIVKQLIQVPQWPLFMRCTDDSDKMTTPFREMIKKMPDVAEVVLNKCTVYDPEHPNLNDNDYSVIFNYEFIEDARDEGEGNDENDRPKNKREEIKLKIFLEGRQNKNEYECDYDTIRERSDTQNYSTSWGPVGFKKPNHPLSIMVEYKRLNLLTHPLVGSLLHHKWNKFGQYGYIMNLMTYCVFLIFLTTFALIIDNPRSQACFTMSVNISDSGSDCSVGIVRLRFIYISAIIVVILSLCRLVLEGIQFVTQFPRYILDWINWMEIMLYISSIMFVWVFHVDCRCPLTWQWQIGVVAVFLGWIDLIVFISKFPLTGIYVLMFVKVFYTFLKILILAVLLVVAFGLTFYLAFTQPEILRSPFSNPGRSLLKTMTMTTGEFDFDSIFRQDPAGGSDGAEEIPFPPISYMLWIVFVIIMPILLTNMLVGLAVGDIQAVQDEAALQKLALQVEQVLTVEELLPRKWRRRFTAGYKMVYPNYKLSWKKKFLNLVWGGERYDTQASIEKVHLHEDENERTREKDDNNILHKLEHIKTSIDNENQQNEELRQKTDHEIENLKDENEQIQEKADNILHKLEHMKTSIDKENEELRQKSDEIVHEIEDLKTSVNDIKQLLQQITVRLEATEISER